jgi:sugar phosphate isomerase/epimerase
MVRTAIIKGMIGHLDDDGAHTIGRISDAGYEGVELGIDDVGTTTVSAMADANIDPTSVMTGLEQVRSPDDDLLSACEMLESDRVVLGWLDESYYESVEATKDTAALLNECATTLGDHGLTLCYHNHDHEFAGLDDGRTAFDLLVDHLDEGIEFEFDVGWIGNAGEDPAEYIQRYADRTPLVHLKDMCFKTGESVRLGAGDLDVQTVIREATEANVEWLIYEHEQPHDAEASMQHAATRMNDSVSATTGETG